MQAKQLPHSLTLCASASSRDVLPGAAGGEVTDKELQPLAGPKLGARPLAPARRRPVVGPHIRAALDADVLQALHGLAQLPVHLLLRSLTPPSIFPLLSFLEEPQDLELQPGIILLHEPPGIGHQNGAEILGHQPQACLIEPRRVAQSGNLKHVYRRRELQMSPNLDLALSLQPGNPVLV